MSRMFDPAVINASAESFNAYSRQQFLLGFPEAG